MYYLLLSIYPSMYLSVCLSIIYLPIYVSIIIYLFIYRSIYLSMTLLVYLSIYVTIYLCIHQFMYLSVCPSLHTVVQDGMKTVPHTWSLLPSSEEELLSPSISFMASTFLRTTVTKVSHSLGLSGTVLWLGWGCAFWTGILQKWCLLRGSPGKMGDIAVSYCCTGWVRTPQGGAFLASPLESSCLCLWFLTIR